MAVTMGWQDYGGIVSSLVSLCENFSYTDGEENGDPKKREREIEKKTRYKRISENRRSVSPVRERRIRNRGSAFELFLYTSVVAC